MKTKLLKINFLLSLILLSLTIHAQTIYPVWEKCYGGEEWDEGFSLTQVGDYYYIVGNTQSNDGDISFNHGNYDIWLIKTDLQGNMIYEKTIGGSSGEGNPIIKPLNDSIFYIVGQTASDDGDISNNPWPLPYNPSLWVIKIKESGEIIWEKVFGGSYKEHAESFLVTPDSGIISLTQTTSQDGDISDPHGSWDLWAIKVSKNGEKQWEKSYGGDGYEGCGSICATSDGGYLIIGNTDGKGGGNYDSTCNHHYPASGFDDIWVIKTDSIGEIQWQQCYGGYYNESGANVLELQDGYLLLGATMSNDGDVSGYHGTPGNTDNGLDIWTVKIDFEGNIIWQKCLGGSSWDYAWEIFNTSDSGFMVVGYTGSDDGDVVGYHGIDTGIYEDVWLAKISSTGEFQWQYCYGGGGRENFYRGVIQKGDFNYVLTLGTDTDEWQCHGMMWPSLRIVELNDSTTSINEESNLIFNLYPNPTTSMLIVEMEAGSKQQDLLEIYNSTGARVYSAHTTNTKTTVDVSSWSRGIYIVKVINTGAQADACASYSRKVVVR